MKRKLLSPIELKEFRLQQEEQKRIRAAELERKNKKFTSPKDLLDPKPVVEVKEEPIVEEPKDPIEILRERVKKLASTIKEPKYYDEEHQPHPSTSVRDTSITFTPPLTGGYFFVNINTSTTKE